MADDIRWRGHGDGPLAAPDARARASQVRVQDALIIGADLIGTKLPASSRPAPRSTAATSAGRCCVAAPSACRPASHTATACSTAPTCAASRQAAPRFERRRITDTRLEKRLCFTTEFVGCRFACRVTEVNFCGDVFPAGSRSAPGRVRNEFTGDNFRAAELSGVAFLGGIDLNAQELPDDPRYALIRHARQRIAVAREQVNRWPAGPDQTAAVMYLDFYSSRGYELQEDIFLDQHILSRVVPAEICQRILALLLTDPHH